MDAVCGASAPPFSNLTGAERDLSVYMTLADADQNIFSVFDDLKYDRSDADIMSPGMRTHAAAQLKPFGFNQVSGSVLQNKDEDIVCYIPKPQVLGASPFDITRYTPKRPQDYYVLTPTQTACRFIDTYAFEEAVERITALVQKQPINLLRLMDYLEDKPAHINIRKALGHFQAVQKLAVASEPLRRRRAL
ncbi:hypothetical protein [Roseibium denhamense]|uniref:Uncharacterized protein n=1 Tax=Roseibium denhamense TaxID=76305 RepID=A0ABY1P3A0_9HYPH|nr:hypothetical protein [Roseibium denhamense]SMP25481.1 hypothetical protein SAMN06265374_2568 [Roseibium denhamense]